MSYKTGLLIGGQWQEAENGGTFPVLDPADESTIAHVSSATVGDARRAVDAAAEAAAGWAALLPRERSNILMRAYELIKDRSSHLSELITRENGKGRADADSEILYAAEFFRWYAEEGVRIAGHVGHAPASGARTLVHARPAGISLLITPWNYPAAMGTRKIAPALAAGCTVIVKPASETPLTMLELGALLAEAGVPAGVVNILPSRSSQQISETILTDDRVRVLSFTGSTEIGRSLLRLAAGRVIKPAMELGGNAPFIVFDDADLEAAVAGLMIAKLRNLGEACTAANRIYLHEDIHDRFVASLTEKMRALKVGPGLDPGVDIGPLVNAATRAKVHELVTEATSKGAKLQLGGKMMEGKGFFYPPTILVDVPDNAGCLRDEIFGPVAAIQKFKDEDDVIRRANDTEYGLVAYVFTRDLARGLRVSEQLEYGMIGLNRGLVSDPAAPFGGMKQSGLGREGSSDGLEEFLEKQYISTLW